MTLALNEVEATAKKAARGVGYSWGLAEEAGKAVRWLCARDVDGCAALAALLERIDGVDQAALLPVPGNDVWAASGIVCPFMAGVALSDRAAILGGGLTIENVICPILLAPFAASVAETREVMVSMRFDGVTVSTDGVELSITGDWNVRAATIGLDLKGKLGSLLPHSTRAHPDKSVWDVLNQFAHRTYAPATEESRLKGAGAGLSDND